jgi:hypothetical protein
VSKVISLWKNLTNLRINEDAMVDGPLGDDGTVVETRWNPAEIVGTVRVDV